MKYTKVLCLLICFTLGCSTDYNFDAPLTGYTKTGSTVQVLPTSLSSMQNATGNMLIALRNNPKAFLVTENGLEIAKLSNYTGNPALNYMNNMRFLKPQANLPDTDLATLRATIVNNLNKFQNSQSFKNNLLSSFDYMRMINTQTFQQFESYFENKLTNISVSPFLTELEKFALTQAYYSVLNLTRWIYQHPSSSSVTGQCLPATKEEWIAVAEMAFYGGLGMGTTLAINGAAAGAIATAPAGGGIVGFTVGGTLGFILGFTVGAIGGAVSKLLWHCLSNKLFSVKKRMTCSGKVVYTYSVSAPIGCTLIDGLPSLRDIVNLGLVPNKGKTSLNASVVADLNYLLKYL